MAFAITPSILTADLVNLAGEIGRISNADELHLDVMDNHFVPSLTFGLPVVKSIRAFTDMPLDAHLMIADPDRWAVEYAEAGCENVTFHIEAAKAPIRLARQLRQLGAKVGVALNPATPVCVLEHILDEIDRVLVMTVEPGFGGQKFIAAVLDKVKELASLARGKDLIIQLDGGISLATIGACVHAGANSFVAGSAVFSAADPNAMITDLRQAAHSASLVQA